MDINCIVAGSRGFNNRDVAFMVLVRCFNQARLRGDVITIISGTARGADRLGEMYAISRNYPLIKMPANWNLYGNSAGYRRNEQMAKVATHLIAFWDGASRGTKSMIDLAVRLDLKVRVFDYDGEIRYTHNGNYEEKYGDNTVLNQT